MTTMPLDLPGPKALPLLGNLPWMMRNPLVFLTHLGRTYGDMAHFRLGRRSLVLINNPDLLDRVIRDANFHRTWQGRRILAAALGEGLFSMEGDLHRQQRRLMQPAFHRERIRRYVDIMVDLTHAALDRWVIGQPLNLSAEMMRLTFKIVSQALFNSNTDDEAQAVDRSLRLLLPWANQLIRAYSAFAKEKPIPMPPFAQREIDRLQALVQRVIAERRRDGGDRGDLLSMLIAAQDEDGTRMTDAQIAAQSLSLILAGHETTSNTLNWAWYLLSQHPEVVERLAAEVQTVTGGAPVSAEHVPHLLYTDQVIRETLRLYPPAWIGQRVCAQDAEVGGYMFPAGTPMMFSVYVTHRDPRFFPAPLRFDPDRFSPERVGDIPQYGYLPFGAGVHICIGNTFALMEGRIILAEMVRRFRISAVPGQDVQPQTGVTLGMREPFWVQIAAAGALTATT